MEIKSYTDIGVQLLQSTNNPGQILTLALDITQKKNLTPREVTPKTLKAILKMNHGSVFEHLIYTFLITGASRSFLAQTTRHRIMSPTSGSQHYQEYSAYGASVDESLVNDEDMKKGLEASMEAYKRMIARGIPISEARQVLPNAMQNNLITTWNARSLMNFLNLRLCNRNTNEIKIVANKMRQVLINHYSPIWSNIGPDCFQDKCRQGKMYCGNPWKLSE